MTMVLLGWGKIIIQFRARGEGLSEIVKGNLVKKVRVRRVRAQSGANRKKKHVGGGGEKKKSFDGG